MDIKNTFQTNSGTLGLMGFRCEKAGKIIVFMKDIAGQDQFEADKFEGCV